MIFVGQISTGSADISLEFLYLQGCSGGCHRAIRTPRNTAF